jgi:hypothetical protein
MTKFEHALFKAAMPSLKVAAGVFLTGVMTVVLWVMVIEILD